MTNGGKMECMASGRFLRMERKCKFRECADLCVCVCVCGCVCVWGIDGIVDVGERWEANTHSADLFLSGFLSFSLRQFYTYQTHLFALLSQRS